MDAKFKDIVDALDPKHRALLAMAPVTYGGKAGATSVWRDPSAQRIELNSAQSFDGELAVRNEHLLARHGDRSAPTPVVVERAIEDPRNTISEADDQDLVRGFSGVRDV